MTLITRLLKNQYWDDISRKFFNGNALILNSIRSIILIRGGHSKMVTTTADWMSWAYTDSLLIFWKSAPQEVSLNELIDILSKDDLHRSQKYTYENIPGMAQYRRLLKDPKTPVMMTDTGRTYAQATLTPASEWTPSPASVARAQRSSLPKSSPSPSGRGGRQSRGSGRGERHNNNNKSPQPHISPVQQPTSAQREINQQQEQLTLALQQQQAQYNRILGQVRGLGVRQHPEASNLDLDDEDFADQLRAEAARRNGATHNNTMIHLPQQGGNGSEQ